MSRKKMSQSKSAVNTEALLAKAVSGSVQTEAPQSAPKKTKKKATKAVAKKKTTATKAVAKKKTAKKAPAKKAAAKKTAVKKTPAKAGAKKATVRKTPEKKHSLDAESQMRVHTAFDQAEESFKSNFTSHVTGPEHEEKMSEISTPVGTGEWALSQDDIYLFNEGRHFHLHHKLGAHPSRQNGQDGFQFTVWAPNAQYISVIGNFNEWDKGTHPLSPVEGSGLWSCFVPGVKKGDLYKFYLHSSSNDYRVEKADPFAFYSEVAPQTASITWTSDYKWQDKSWMKSRKKLQAADQAMSIYELHLGSWRRKHDDNFYSYSYRELAEVLPEYIKNLGFTHVELMPILEHPFFGSWGYQVTGYFAPTSRYGTPDDLKYLIDKLHQAGIGVLLDWVPSHFPSDEMGLNYFDGTHLFEHADPREGYHPDWNSMIFNYGRNEVRSFLISSALYWLEEFHMDGLRVDAVASMLYRDYSRKDGEWIPNKDGGRENYEAIDFLKQLNETIYLNHPDTHMIAEESTAWSMVSRPTSMGGLGFGMKWDMGWMHDTLKYFQLDPVHRKHHHSELSFRMVYAFNENFVLSISHDEVVHGKGSVLNKMPGDNWQKFANLRAMYGYMYAQPGKKLLFMGSEFGQWGEWNHDGELEWHLLEQTKHKGLSKLVADLNSLYKHNPALHQTDFEHGGFQWIENNDWAQSVYSFLRTDRKKDQIVVAVMNLTPMPRHNYQVGVPVGGSWSEVFNSDAKEYGGSGHGNMGAVEASPVGAHGRPFSLNLTLPPLSAIYLKTERPKDAKAADLPEIAWSAFE